MSWRSQKHKLQRNTELNLVIEDNDNWNYRRTMEFSVGSGSVGVCVWPPIRCSQAIRTTLIEWQKSILFTIF